MSTFLWRVRAAVEKRRLLSRGQTILVAVSGGVDSMVLVHVLHALAKPCGWKIAVAHYNHRLRGRASDADEQLVRQTAKRLRLKCFVAGGDVKAFAAAAGISVEMGARKLRHEFLARTAREQGISTIALAHHADDQVELFFLRLFRGAGGEGLAGMKRRSPSPADRNISLVRPLLDFSKHELALFARENEIRFREDNSNGSAAFLRNRIRNELLPLLRKKYQIGVDKTVLRLMDLVGAEAEFVAAAADRIRNPESGIRDSFDHLPLAIQRKLLHQRIEALGLPPDFELIERLREQPDRPVTFAAGVEVVRDAAGKILCRRPARNDFSGARLELKLRGRVGRTEFAGHEFSWEQRAVARRLGRLPRRAGMEHFDAGKIGGEIVLRQWQPGDRFQPIGMSSAVKLQDLFVNARVPAAQRRKLVVAVAAGGEIFWVERLRIGEKFKLTPETRRVFVWKHPEIGG